VRHPSLYTARRETNAEKVSRCASISVIPIELSVWQSTQKNTSSCQTAAAAHLLWPNEWSGWLVAHCGESVLGSHPCVVPITAIWRFDAINVYTRSAAAAAAFFFCSHCTVTLLCDGAREWIHPKVPIWRRLFIDTLSRPRSNFLKHDTAGSHSALARTPPRLLLLYICAARRPLEIFC
jgi:hypothetical protein